ncbi:MAG: hypothetical protein AABX84_02045 [Nanoarchaeota archaeon]
MNSKRDELIFLEKIRPGLAKQGQITIFVIVVILIIAIVGLFFLFRTGVFPGIGGGTKEANVNTFLSSCIEDKIREAIEEISLSGGKIENPLSVRFLFDEDERYYNISYLCYTSSNYIPCVNQNPLLIKNFGDEIKDYISDEVENCFNEMENNFERQNFDVNLEYNGFEVNIQPRKISAETNSKLILTKNEETTTQENFKIEIVSRLYEILGVVQEIANQEAEFCNFNLDGFMLTYPKFKTEKWSLDDEGLIYTVKYRDTGEKFRFAIRSCFIPTGITPN